MGSPRPITHAERLARYDLDGSRHLAEGRKPKYAMPNGTYPINNCADVDDAWHLRGHSATYSRDDVASHVRRAARRLGCPVPTTEKRGGQPTVGSVHVSTPLEGTEMADTRECKCCAQCDDKCDGKCCSDCTMKYAEINSKKLQPKMARLTEKQVASFSEIKLDDRDIATSGRSWMPVFPEGEFSHPEYGDLIFNAKTIPEYIENFQSKVRHIEPCVDIDHRNEEAAGWIKQLDWRRGIGLFALVEWNGLGKELLKDKRYRYSSAQFGDYEDEETGKVTENVLSAITLTNFPFLKKMEAISLAERDEARELFTSIKSLHEDLHAGRLALPEKLHKTIDLWLDGRVLKGIPHPEARLSDARAIVKTVRALLREEPAMAKNLTRPEFIKNNPAGQGGSGMARAEEAKKADELAEDDEEMADDAAPDAEAKKKVIPFKKAKKADAKADDDELDGKAAKLYDSDDVWEDDSMENFRGESEQPNRSDGQAPAAPSVAGTKAMAEPKTLAEFQKALATERSQRIALERMVAPVVRELRETKVAAQVRELSEGSIAYGAKVLSEFEEIALADKKRGNDIFHFLKLAREDGGLILMGEFGDGEDADDLHDLLGGSGEVTKRFKGDPVIGAKLVRLAKDYAKENKLNWDDPEDKLIAMQSVSADRKLADDDGYARRTRR